MLIFLVITFAVVSMVPVKKLYSIQISVYELNTNLSLILQLQYIILFPLVLFINGTLLSKDVFENLPSVGNVEYHKNIFDCLSLAALNEYY